MKRILSILLSISIFITLCSCKTDLSNSNKPKKTVLPDYDSFEDKNVMMISSFGAPEPRDDEFQKYVDCNFTAMYLTQYNSYSHLLNTKEDYSYDKSKKVNKYNYATQLELDEDYLKLGKKFGINILPSCNSHLPGDISAEKRAVYDKYSSYMGFLFCDEPFMKHIGNLTKRAEVFNSVSPDKLFYVNLNPNYGFGSVGMTGAAYWEYLDYFCTNVLDKISGRKILSVDNYPIRTAGLNGCDYLSNFGDMRYVASKHKNTELHMVLQSVTMNHEPGSEELYTKKLTEQDMRIQVYTSLCFGVKSLSWFTYAPMYWMGGGYGEEVAYSPILSSCIDFYNEKMPQYDWVQKVNGEVLALDNVYLNFDWKNISWLPAKDGKANSEYESVMKDMFMYDLNNDPDIEEPMLIKNIAKTKTLKSAESTGSDVLVGIFEDENKNEGFMLTAFSDYSTEAPFEYENSAKVDIEFDYANKVYVINNGKKSIENVKDNKLSLDVKVGDGVFIIPINE